MPDIDTQPPPWLQRNWAPHQSFDPLPWLQAGYQRAIDKETIPLKIQALNLQNEAARLGIQQQAMATELQGEQLRQYQEELPAFNDWLKASGGSAKALTEGPLPTFASPMLQKQALDVVGAASKTQYGLLMHERTVEQERAALDLLKRGGREVKRLPNGMLDAGDLSAVAGEVQEREHTLKMEEIAGRTAWHAGVAGRIGGITPDVTEKQAMALERARARVEQAYAIGDASEIDDAEAFLSDLKSAMARQHPEKSGATEEAMLMTKYRALTQAYARNPGDKDVAAELKEVEERLRTMQALRSGTKQAPAAPAIDVGRFKVIVR